MSRSVTSTSSTGGSGRSLTGGGGLATGAAVAPFAEVAAGSACPAPSAGAVEGVGDVGAEDGCAVEAAAGSAFPAAVAAVGVGVGVVPSFLRARYSRTAASTQAATHPQ